MKATIKYLSILLGIFSLVSFIQHLFDVGLFTTANELLKYYRTVAYFIFELPVGIFGISLPKELMDLWSLSFIGSAAYVKTKNIENTRFFRSRRHLTKNPYWKVWLFIIFGLSGLGLAVLLSTISLSTYVDEYSEEPLDVARGAAKNTLIIIIGAIVVFIINAFAPPV